MEEAGKRRCAVITGASSGVGREAAKQLAAEGWHVIAHGRDLTRLAEAEEEMRSVAGDGARIDMVRCDLSSLADTARMATEIAALTDRVDALCNNAGGVRDSLIITAEGNEATFAGNHLGHFLLTRQLLPLLEVASGRVVCVSSEGHRMSPPLDWADLQSEKDWVSGRAYRIAKLCNVLFVRELARRAAPRGIVANAMHPGEVASNFAAHAVPEMKAYMNTLDLLPPSISAATLVWLAGAPETASLTGGYFHDFAPVEPGELALDPVAAARLWDESEALLARAGF